MLLIRHSQRASNAVRTASSGGELFVGSVVVCMLLASFGDAVDPTLLGEAGLEFALFDLGGEFSLLAMSQWQLIELLMAGGAVAAGISVLRVVMATLFPAMHAPPARDVEKVPIEL